VVLAASRLARPVTALCVTTAAVDYDLVSEIGPDGYLWIRSTRLGVALRLHPQEAATLRDQLAATLDQQETA
jgi:hypothetical protein